MKKRKGSVGAADRMSVQAIAVLLDLPPTVDAVRSGALPNPASLVTQIIAARLQENTICPFRNSKLWVFPIKEP